MQLARARPCLTPAALRIGQLSPNPPMHNRRKLTSRVAHRYSIKCAANQEQSDNIIVRGIVSALTELLRVAGVGSTEYQEKVASVSAVDPLSPGDVDTLMEYLKVDFTDKAYFITGDISDVIYDDNCYFADPTVKFRGLDTWRRNLQLLVPFLQEPSIDLLSLEPNGSTTDGRIKLQARWLLRTYLSFPWLPLIEIKGGTDYELNGTANKIVSHIEFWDVSGWEAILMMFKPSNKTAA